MSNKESKSKRSVRTTFTLTEDAIFDLKCLSEENNITIKKLFEILCEILKSKDAEGYPYKKRLANTERSVKKAYVLSEESLKLLKYYSKKNKIARDILVEYLLETYSEQHRIEKKILRDKHKKSLEIINRFISEAKKYENKLDRLLDDDVVLDIFELIMILSGYLEKRIRAEIEEGIPIDVPVTIAVAMNDLT